MTELTPEFIDNLKVAIIEKAVEDYKLLKLGKIKEQKLCNLQELNAFFNSGWFLLLVGDDRVTYDDVITALDAQVERERQCRTKKYLRIGSSPS